VSLRLHFTRYARGKLVPHVRQPVNAVLGVVAFKSGVLVCLAFLAAMLPYSAFACSCNLEPLDEIFAQSRHVFTATVADVSLLTKSPKNGQRARYLAVLKPTEAFKGELKKVVRVKYRKEFYAPDNGDIVVSADCDAKFSVGDEYLVLMRGDKMPKVHWCSSRIHPIYRVDLSFVRELSHEVRN